MSYIPNAGTPLITWRELRDLVPYTRQHVLRLEKKGKFPRRVHVGDARIAWVRNEVERWMASRVEARDRSQTAGVQSVSLRPLSVMEG
jgi:prophage regulatory protein